MAQALSSDNKRSSAAYSCCLVPSAGCKGLGGALSSEEDIDGTSSDSLPVRWGAVLEMPLHPQMQLPLNREECVCLLQRSKLTQLDSKVGICAWLQKLLP